MILRFKKFLNYNRRIKIFEFLLFKSGFPISRSSRFFSSLIIIKRILHLEILYWKFLDCLRECNSRTAPAEDAASPRRGSSGERTDLEVIAVGKTVVQIRCLAEQSSARGASVAIDYLLLHRVLDEVALVLSAVTLRQELRHLLRSAVRAVHLAQLHRGQEGPRTSPSAAIRAPARPSAYWPRILQTSDARMGTLRSGGGKHTSKCLLLAGCQLQTPVSLRYDVVHLRPSPHGR